MPCYQSILYSSSANHPIIPSVFGVFGSRGKREEGEEEVAKKKSVEEMIKLLTAACFASLVDQQQHNCLSAQPFLPLCYCAIERERAQYNNVNHK